MPNKKTRFSKEDIIIPADALYPSGALVVAGYDGNGDLLVYPKGGGPEFRIRAADVRRFSVVEQSGGADLSEELLQHRWCGRRIYRLVGWRVLEWLGEAQV